MVDCSDCCCLCFSKETVYELAWCGGGVEKGKTLGNAGSCGRCRQAFHCPLCPKRKRGTTKDAPIVVQVPCAELRCPLPPVCSPAADYHPHPPITASQCSPEWQCGFRWTKAADQPGVPDAQPACQANLWHRAATKEERGRLGRGGEDKRCRTEVRPTQIQVEQVNRTVIVGVALLPRRARESVCEPDGLVLAVHHTVQVEIARIRRHHFHLVR